MNTQVEDVLQASTIIDIEITDAGADDYELSAYLGRSQVTFRLTSNARPERIFENHLGFRSRRIGGRYVRHRGDIYSIICGLDPFVHVQMQVGKLGLVCSNAGDGQTRVVIRLPSGMQNIVMAVLEDGEQVFRAKPYIRLDDTIYYCQVLIGPTQKVHIEEVQEIQHA